VTVREIAEASGRYHARAGQREGVIDYPRPELGRLRRDGYLDIEVNSPVAPAGVAVYAVTKERRQGQ
jgi:hypothetical protein